MRQSDPGSGHHYDSIMSSYNAPFEIHVHGQVQLRADVSFDQLQEALKPLWKYAGARSLADGAASAYEEEPGIKYDAQEHLLQMCWTVRGDEDFRQVLDEMCMSLNELAEQGAAIEVTFYDADFDEAEEEQGAESRDDFVMLFVGPTPAAIMQVQRDLLVQDVVNMMERHFDGAELGGVALVGAAPAVVMVAVVVAVRATCTDSFIQPHTGVPVWGCLACAGGKS